jgi:putative DNA primase/helicase
VADLQAAVCRLPAQEPDRSARLTEIVQAAGTLTPVECEAALGFVKNVTGMPIGVLRTEAAKSGQRGDDHLAFARSTIEQIGASNILYAQSHFWRWTGSVWKRRDDIAIAKDAITTLTTNAQKVTDAIANSVTGLIRKETYRPDHEFNIGAPDVVNCPTGELELCGGIWVLQQHRREHYRTTQIPACYDATAQAPQFIQFLYDIFRDDYDRDAKIVCVLELIGYTLMSHANHEKFVLLIGNGANGKSVLLRVIEALVGRDNVAGVKPSEFGSKWQRAHLHMKLANIVSELPEGKLIADDELKAITSGELTTVEMKNRDPFDMRAFATCWFGTNHMPHTRDFSDGIYRRAVILPFNRKFEEREQDKQLADKLLTELPGVLNLALEYYAGALRNGFTLPPSTLDAREEWRREADQVRTFVAECCTPDPAGDMALSDLHHHFDLWARKSGVRHAAGIVAFGKRLRGQGYRTWHNDGTRIGGLRLKQPLPGEMPTVVQQPPR